MYYTIYHLSYDILYTIHSIAYSIYYILYTIYYVLHTIYFIGQPGVFPAPGGHADAVCEDVEAADGAVHGLRLCIYIYIYI